MSRWLAETATWLGPARVRGRLYDLGAYPALVPPRGSAEWVVGDLYRLRSVAATLRVLDRYENGTSLIGSPVFVLAPCRVESGRGRMTAVAYFYARGVAGRRVRSGDYLEHRARTKAACAASAKRRSMATPPAACLERAAGTQAPENSGIPGRARAHWFPI